MIDTPKPKFTKVDEHTIRITIEKSNDVPLSQILENKKTLLEQKEQLKQQFLTGEKQIDQTLQNIEEILTKAKELGIVAKVENLKKKEKK